MNLIVAAFRALAKTTRLRMMRMVCTQGPLTVQQIAKALRLSKFAASRHLKLLANYHFVQATPSGRYVKYSAPAPGSTSNTFLMALQRLLVPLLSAEDVHRTLVQVCEPGDSPRGTWPEVFSALYRQFTAYTHLRRVLILRHLSHTGAALPEQVASAIRMSPEAAQRHLDKLRRRGLVRSSAHKNGCCEIVKGEGSPVRQELISIVLRSAQPGT
ncbi:MAG: metalloregulator ArsR/SmtB family transcription factor [Planctomycetes bacterium]|nr:metalloregulator ArsR/SmtB family transcription factor [Planctomycetota bacterium]